MNSLTLALAILSICALIGYGVIEDRHSSILPVAKLSMDTSEERPLGTPARKEREYKIGLFDIERDRPKKLSSAIYRILKKAADQRELWQVAPFFQHDYKVTSSEEEFVFRDIYFDTPQEQLAQKGGSLRLRYRWESRFSYERFASGQHSPEARPTRVEVQAKLQRVEELAGYSVANESRLEFSRKEAPIFPYFELGRARLLLPLFTQVVKTGYFESRAHFPAKSVSSFLSQEFPEQNEFRLQPKVLVLALRSRMHLHMATPWGSGPNPDHAFIISLDRYWGAELSADLRWEHQLERVLRQSVSEREPFVEIEIEFERNTSETLDEAIDREQDSRQKAELEKVRALFLADQKTLKVEIERQLEASGVRLAPRSRTKLWQVQNRERLAKEEK